MLAKMGKSCDGWSANTVQPLRKSVWQLFRKLKINCQDPAIPLWGIHPKDSTSYCRDIYPIKFIAPLFMIHRN